MSPTTLERPELDQDSLVGLEAYRLRLQAQNGGSGDSPQPPKQSGDRPWYRKVPWIAVVIVGVLLAIAAVVLVTTLGDDSKQSAKPPTVAPQQIPGAETLSGTAAQRAAVNRYLQGLGWKRNEYSFRITQPANANRGPQAVSEKPIFTIGQLKTWLRSGSPRAKAYLAVVRTRTTKSDFQQIAAGNGFVRVQFRKSGIYTRNSSFGASGVTVFGSRTARAAGDVVFYHVRTRPVQLKDGSFKLAGYVVGMSATRGACGNPGVVFKPQRAVPPAPPKPPTPPSGKTPSGSQPGSGRIPEETHPPQPGGDKLGGGRPQQRGGNYGDEYRRVPGTPSTPKTRPVSPKNPPVITPPETGGEIKPGQQGPATDPSGAPPSQPSAPPTPQASEPPSSTPPPAPEQDAPPPPAP